MALTPQEVADLDARAQQVGEKIGWQLRFFAAPNPEYVTLTASDDQICIVGPSKLSDLAAFEIDLILDELENGKRSIQPDEDGDPRLV